MSAPRILLIEDNADDEAFVFEALKVFDVSGVMVARDGQEALDILEERFGRHGVPDLILMDLKLPRFSGFDVLKRIRKEEKMRAVPVVIFSSSSDLNDVRESYGLGANSFVPKPVSFEEFEGAIRAIVSYWLDVNAKANAPWRTHVIDRATNQPDDKAPRD